MKSLLALFVSATVAAAAEIPPLLTTSAGQPVTTAEQWRTERRPELLELFRKNVYGRAPVGRPDGMKMEVTDTKADAMDGAATRKLVKISYRGPGGEGAINLTLFIPNHRAQPAPCFLLICNRPVDNIDPTREKKSPFWPAEQIVARGYAAATFFNGDVAPDKPDASKPASMPSSIPLSVRPMRGAPSPRGRGAPAAAWITSKPTAASTRSTSP